MSILPSGPGRTLDVLVRRFRFRGMILVKKRFRRTRDGGGGIDMELSEGLRTRRSTRVFLDTPVQKDTLRRIVESAQRAPSAGNMQPWELFAVCGETMERLRSTVNAAFEGDGAIASPGLAKPAPERYSERRRGLYREVEPFFRRIGCGGEFIPEGSFRFFGAPAVVMVYVHEDLLPGRLVCCGSIMTYLTLAAHAEGLGTCAIGFVRTADRQMREVLSVPPELAFVVAVAAGYPNPASPANEFCSSRASVDEVCRFFD